jgi:hypothetical protein
MKLDRIYHHYSKWEEVPAGMWRLVTGAEHDDLLAKAIKFTGDASLYGSWMLIALDRWPFSCEQNLSCPSMNRQAWIGHAATCLAINCPEAITREAWRFLSVKQQDDANAKADEAILEWENRHSIGSPEENDLCLKSD